MPHTLSTQDLLTDALVLQKHMTEAFNNAANESAHDKLRMKFIELLREEHLLQASVWELMNKKGMYQTKPADANAINTAQSKFSAMQHQMPWQ